MAGLEKYNPYEYSSEVGGYWDMRDADLGDITKGYGYQDENVYASATNPTTYIPNDQPDNDATLKKCIGTGVSLVSLIAENLLSHPFVVLRRQCQVHNNSKRYHILPITLVPVICHLHTHQGLTTLWKGLGSILLVRGMTLGVEDVLSKITFWPKEIEKESSLKSFFQHIFLKGITFSIIMPFYCASLVETVQSDIASEKPGMFDVIREGTMRLFNLSGNAKGRMLPIWVLALPTITFGITRYLFSLLVKAGTFRLLQVQEKGSRISTGTLPKDISNIGLLQDLELNSSIIAIVTSDIAFYPFETILHRLYLQGTRTIIDNLDTGKSVLPILTNYYGPVDCYETCLSTEGVFGLYKGFGALLLQYTAHIFVVRFTRFILTQVMSIYRGRLSNVPVRTQKGNDLISNELI